jgi:hypothetical protein
MIRIYVALESFCRSDALKEIEAILGDSPKAAGLDTAPEKALVE